MKVVVSAQDLKRALNTCNEIAPVSSTIAEEKTGVMIKAVDKRLLFMSSDESSFVSVEVLPLKIEETGEALVRCGAVAAAVAASFEDTNFDGTPNLIKLETTDKGTLKVSGANIVREGKSRPVFRNFPLLNVGFFIENPVFEPEKATQFPSFQFMDGLSKVGHAASKDAAKQTFNCINLTLTDDEVVFAATDGIQIAEFRRAAEVKGLRGSFILGLKFASVAARLVNPGKFDFVDIYVQDDYFFLKSGGTVLVGTLLNTKFPDYSNYMRTVGLKNAVFPREDFLSVLQGMQPTVDAKSHRLVLEAHKAGSATLSTSSVSGEAISSGLDVATPEDFSLHFDSTLLQNSIRQLKGEDFSLFFTQDAKGVLLKSEKDDDFKAFVCTLKKVD